MVTFVDAVKMSLFLPFVWLGRQVHQDGGTAQINTEKEQKEEIAVKTKRIVIFQC